MSAFPESIKCPVCFEIPAREIVQCKNGHIVCSGCATQLFSCPQCRAIFDFVKIRNRALEEMLDTLKFNCAYTAKGCHAKLSRQELCEHQEKCFFRGDQLNLCRKLGFPCDYITSTNKVEDAIRHFRTHIENPVYRPNDNPSVVTLGLLKPVDRNLKGIWGPLFINLNSVKGYSFAVLFTFVPGDQTISPIFLQVNHAVSDMTHGFMDVRADFCIKAVKNKRKSKDISWSLRAVNVKDVEDVLKQRIIRFPAKELYADYGLMSLPVHITIFKNGAKVLGNGTGFPYTVTNSFTQKELIGSEQESYVGTFMESPKFSGTSFGSSAIRYGGDPRLQ